MYRTQPLSWVGSANNAGARLAAPAEIIKNLLLKTSRPLVDVGEALG
ncbi:MAG: hypothetical protein ABI947_00485 [Chloroflexota bacterium]